MKTARKKCSVNVTRWISYAAAGAATVTAASEAEAAFTYLYSGPMSTMIKAASGTIAFPASFELRPIQVNGHPGTMGLLGTIINNNAHNNTYHGHAGKDYWRGYAYSGTHPGSIRVAGFKTGGNLYMSRLGLGAKIATQHFATKTSVNMFMASRSVGGNFKWAGGAGLTGFMGFEFEIGGGPEHYGWAKFENTTGGLKNGLELLGYAYSDDPNFVTGQTVAPTPEPASLGLLAMGAIGLLTARARRKAKAKAK